MRRQVGPGGNDIFENDTVGGVPAFAYMGIASRLHTGKGREAFEPDYGVDFPPSVGKDDPQSAVSSEIERALKGVPYSEVLTSTNVDANTIDIEISGGPEGWTMKFGISLEDGSLVNFPLFVIDEKKFGPTREGDA